MKNFVQHSWFLSQDSTAHILLIYYRRLDRKLRIRYGLLGIFSDYGARSSCYRRTLSTKMNLDTTALPERQNAVEHPLAMSNNLVFKRSASTNLVLMVWAAFTFALIAAKLTGSLTLAWAIVLAPIWLPLLVMACVLLGAMWLDQLSTRRRH